MNGDAASHGGEDTTNIVGAEVVGVERTREVADPEIRHDLVHRHGSPRCSRARRDKVLCAICVRVGTVEGDYISRAEECEQKENESERVGE